RRHTRSKRDWSSDVCSSDLGSEWTNSRLSRSPISPSKTALVWTTSSLALFQAMAIFLCSKPLPLDTAPPAALLPPAAVLSEPPHDRQSVGWGRRARLRAQRR